jgi:hypothetical protein
VNGQDRSKRGVDVGRDLDPVLDPKQLSRIEGVHRGFFYQHLYAVNLLLLMPGSQTASVAVERDEDVEVRRPNLTIYIQVKTRVGPLTPSDIDGALDRFADIREAHRRGDRSGEVTFVIVANSEPSAALAARRAVDGWPADVALLTPESVPVHGLPMPAGSIEEALARCEVVAAGIPFGGLAPATLVLKLATIVQHTSTGSRDHVITADDLPVLLEQIVDQLQDFPEPPRPYHPQRDEPPIISDQRVRLVIGFSGAGKTAWAAEAVRHRPEPIAYFDVSELPAASIASNLAREIVARFLGGSERSARLPPSGGLDMLRTADALLAERGTRILVVLDNAHRLSAGEFRQIVEAAPDTAFLALAQPWPDRALIEVTLDVECELLQGYDIDAVAAVFASEDVGIDVPDAEAVLRLTGGLPLYIANAARLTAKIYAGDAKAFCEAIERRTHERDIAQDLILEASFEALSSHARDAVALLGLCDVPITSDEAAVLLNDLGEQWAAAVRELRRASMVINYPDGLGLHDALRPLAAGRRLTLAHERIDSALERLHTILMASLRRNHSIPRITSLVRLLPRVGRTDVVVDLATSEMFYEQGNMAVMWDTLVAAAEDTTTSPRDRFWPLDAIAYWKSRDGGIPDPDVVATMATLVEENPDFALRERLNLLFKQLILAASAGDRRRVEKLSETGRRLTRDHPMESRIFRYNRAVALYRIGALDAVRKALEPLIDDMFKVFGFPERQLIGTNREELVELLSQAGDPEEVKRAADALNLWCTVVVRMGDFPGLRRIQAMKLYASTAAGRSAVVAGQDAADEMLKFAGDATGARELMEDKIMPLITQYGLTDLALQARGEYAVILAYCGDFEGADREIAALRNYGGDEIRQEEFEHQAVTVEGIRAGVLTARPRRPRRVGLQYVFEPNRIGRDRGPDDPCHCGSGRKYKRCHGKRR